MDQVNCAAVLKPPTGSSLTAANIAAAEINAARRQSQIISSIDRMKHRDSTDQALASQLVQQASASRRAHESNADHMIEQMSMHAFPRMHNGAGPNVERFLLRTPSPDVPSPDRESDDTQEGGFDENDRTRANTPDVADMNATQGSVSDADASGDETANDAPGGDEPALDDIDRLVNVHAAKAYVKPFRAGMEAGLRTGYIGKDGHLLVRAANGDRVTGPPLAGVSKVLYTKRQLGMPTIMQRMGIEGNAAQQRIQAKNIAEALVSSDMLHSTVNTENLNALFSLANMALPRLVIQAPAGPGQRVLKTREGTYTMESRIHRALQ